MGGILLQVEKCQFELEQEMASMKTAMGDKERQTEQLTNSLQQQQAQHTKEIQVTSFYHSL